MLGNTLTIMATDGTKLQGILYHSNENSKGIIIHVHGMAGNFYENSFIEVIASKCNEKGFDFLAFNNRGHDYIADCERVTSAGTESYSAGGAYEIFSECLFDLEGVVQWVINAGYSSIFLEGHSSGANKIVYSFEEMHNLVGIENVVKGIVLISPCDDIGIFQDETSEEERAKSFALANKYIDEGNGNHLMPLGTFFDYLLSAQTFISCFSEGSALDMFPYRNGSLVGTKIANIQLPLLVQFGNKGEFILQKPQLIEEMFKQVREKNFTLQIINNASHNYKDHEIELATNIVEWIESVQ